MLRKSRGERSDKDAVRRSIGISETNDGASGNNVDMFDFTHGVPRIFSLVGSQTLKTIMIKADSYSMPAPCSILVDQGAGIIIIQAFLINLPSINLRLL